MELSVLVIVHARSVAQACLVVPQTLDLAGENDVIARPHGLETRTFHFKVNAAMLQLPLFPLFPLVLQIWKEYPLFPLMD